LFITLEGVEGSGKSTQARLLSQNLAQRGFQVLAVEEPGGTALGQWVRDLVKHAASVALTPRSESLLFLASRAQLVDEVIKPALKAGRIVICDRFADSTFAYQCYGRGLDLALVRQVNAFAVEGTMPDLTILLDMPPECGLQRKRQLAVGDSATAVESGNRHQADKIDRWDRFEREALTFHQRVREGYLKLAAEEPSRWLVVDACQPTTVIGELILARVEEALRSSSEEV